ncbi:PAS domain-containing protein [Pelagibius marinus]|uniref:PAS domain-containing protein n=1 Tax=Pelagibius marinus TaxID=2762760 RepID=UPI00187284DF|nr:PAS domain-containing protein [Pelagibius marinus]
MQAYLDKVAPEGKLPGRQHIDPLEFREFMSFINLVDVERVDGDVRFRYRLVGEEQTRRSGREITGKLLKDALVPALVPRVRSNMMKVLMTRKAVFDSFPMPHPDREFIVSQRMYYPLAGDGETIDMLLTLHGYEPDPVVKLPEP